MSKIVGELYWRTPDGVMIELKRVPQKLFLHCNPNIKGVPMIYAIWPEPVEEKTK